MTRYGFKIEGCFGDVLYSVPVLKYLSICHNEKFDLETNYPEIFINNPYINEIYDKNKNQSLPEEQEFYDCNGHYFEDIPKQIRKMHLTDFWSTNFGFVLSPKEKKIEFYPNPIDIDLPKNKYIIVNPSKTWKCRTWSETNWEKLVELIISFGFTVVVIGKDILYNKNDLKTSLQIKNDQVINYVNKLNLSQLWHLINNCEMVITMNAGILPFAGSTDAYILQLGGAIDPSYRTPFRNGTQNYKHKFVGGSCKLFCQSDLKYNTFGGYKVTDGFPVPSCLENKPTYECHPSVNAVYNAFLEILNETK